MILYTDASTGKPSISTTAACGELATGNHEVSIWVRGNGATDTLNRGNFGHEVTVTKLSTASGNELLFTSGTTGGMIGGAPSVRPVRRSRGDGAMLPSP